MRYLLIVLLLAGCSNLQPKLSPPVDMSLIPNDCVNQDRVIRWLESQSKGEWNEYVSQVRARIWHIRYNCNLL
jgi:hypothetical protein